jgi:hypothetical protein
MKINPSTSIGLSDRSADDPENGRRDSKFSDLEKIHSPHPVGTVDTRDPAFRKASAAASRLPGWPSGWPLNVDPGMGGICAVMQ